MKDIVTKYLSGHASEIEQKKLLKWLRKHENRIVFTGLKLDWRKNSHGHPLPEGSEKSWLAIQDQILQKSFKGWQSSKKTNVLLKIAAVFFFLIALGSSLFLFSEQSPDLQEFHTNVLADNGQISKVQLPDGSVVWLNSGSKISYNNCFASGNRDISLEGEAYFEVSRNEAIPMIIKSGEMKVKVLGTKFNVAAYPESDKVDIVLETGKVELLSELVESFHYQLMPGEKASFDKSTRELRIQEVNTLRFTSWKDGMIHIYNQPLVELVKRLEKRYNQKFEFAEELRSYHFTFTIKNESLDEIIQIMEKIAPITAIQQNELIVFKTDMMKKRELSR